ncbi:MAG: VC0807 family protein [Acidimicrobiales bacterium]
MEQTGNAVAGGVRRQLPHLTISAHACGKAGGILRMPAPRTALRHAAPVVLEAVLAPLALFYSVLLLWGFRGALIAALGWSFLALGRRLYRGERASMLLLLGTMLLTVRTAVSFITGSAFLYFAQPTAGTIVIALVLFGSAIIGRPFTQRFAGDFCPMDPELLARPLVQRFFVRISVLWATVLLLNAGFVLWLLVTSSLHAFVLERAAVTYTLTACAIYLSIRQFVRMMRGDGITVQWGAEPALLAVEA